MNNAVSDAFDAARILAGPGSISHRMKYAMMQLKPSDESPFYGPARKTIREIKALISGHGTYDELGSRMSESDLAKVAKPVVRLCAEALEQRIECKWKERTRYAKSVRHPFFDN